uniref:Uncharacterized protein n=1 Tax=Sphenodon punctatus TaxID=8508 RepID=A0A8D0GVM9_SPHPU
TLTDLQEAERTFSRSRAERQAQEQPSEKSESTENTEERRERREEASSISREPGQTLPRWSRNVDDESVYRQLRCPTQPDKPTTPVSPMSTPFLYTSSHQTRTSRCLAPDSVNSADFQSTSA